MWDLAELGHVPMDVCGIQSLCFFVKMSAGQEWFVCRAAGYIWWNLDQTGMFTYIWRTIFVGQGNTAVLH